MVPHTVEAVRGRDDRVDILHADHRAPVLCGRAATAWRIVALEFTPAARGIVAITGRVALHRLDRGPTSD